MSGWHAYQVAPEHQVSPLDYDDLIPVDVSVFGNKDYGELKSEDFKWITDRIKNWHLCDDLYNAYEDYREEHDDNFKPVDEWRCLMLECFSGGLTNPKPEFINLENIKNMDDCSLVKLADYIINIEYVPRRRRYRDEQQELCCIVNALTGRNYTYRCIRGSSQGELNYMYYEADKWSAEGLEAFEIEYWNEGTEWNVLWSFSDSDDEDIDDFDDSSEFRTYCHKYDDDDIKAEIADSVGCKPEEVTLYKFNGWIKTPSYVKA